MLARSVSYSNLVLGVSVNADLKITLDHGLNMAISSRELVSGF